MPCQPYTTLLAFKRWADLDLYDAVGRNFRRLSPEDATLMLRVLDHMHVVDRIFQHHLQGMPHGFGAPRSETLPDLHSLADGATKLADWYVAYTDRVSQDELDQPLDFAFTSGKRARMTRGEILLHVCLHGTYHRGNAGALLQLRGMTPGRDGITNFLEEAA